jgi:chromosome segregation ATPase
MSRRRKGWQGESKRHAIAKKYGRTGRKKTKISRMSSRASRRRRKDDSILGQITSFFEPTKKKSTAFERKKDLLEQHNKEALELEKQHEKAELELERQKEKFEVEKKKIHEREITEERRQEMLQDLERKAETFLHDAASDVEEALDKLVKSFFNI